MARIPRKTAAIFGVGGGAAPGGVGVFGSLGAGSPAYSIDPAVIQAAAAWAAGWGSAVVNDFPALEDLNSVPFVLSQQIAEILQDGIPPYDAGTTYFTGSFSQVAGVIYVSLTDTNIGNTPASSPANWAPFGNLPAVFQNELSPSAINADQANYNPTNWNANVYNLFIHNTAGGNININGLKFNQNGQVVNIVNNSGQTITLTHDSGTPTSSGFILQGAGASIILPALGVSGGKSCVQVYYSGTLSRWLFLSKNF